MAFILAIDNVGMLIGIQRQMDPAWSRMDVYQSIRGIRVSAIGDLLAGLLGGMPTGKSSANISLAHATDGIARRIASLAGVLACATAFSPVVIKAVAMIPRPVVGAVMVYAAAYMLVSGMTLFLARLLSERRMFVVGLSLVAGLCPAVMPGLFLQAPETLRPILESPLALGSLCAIVLTQLLRIGASRRTEVHVELPDSNNEMVHEMHVNKSIRATLLDLGASVGASRQAVYRAIDLTSELVGCLKARELIGNAVEVSASFDDSRLQITLAYEGEAPRIPDQGERDTTLERLYARIDQVMVRGSTSGARMTLAFDA